MLLSHTIESYAPTDCIMYKLLENDVVGMGSQDRIFSYSIYKYHDGCNLPQKRIIDGVKNKDAVFMIWLDIKKGEQK